jgi:hypothetical protein
MSPVNGFGPARYTGKINRRPAHYFVKSAQTVKANDFIHSIMLEGSWQLAAGSWQQKCGFPSLLPTANRLLPTRLSPHTA